MSRYLIEFILCPVCNTEKYSVRYSADGRKICTKCGNDLIITKLRLLDDEDEMPDNCVFCGEEDLRDSAFFSNQKDVIIFKCKKCGGLDGYRYIDLYDYPNFDEPDESQYSNIAIKIAEEEGRPILSPSAHKKIIKVIEKKRKNSKLKCQEKINALIKEKAKELEAAQIDPQIVKNAILRAKHSIRIHGPYTEKQLRILLSATILEIQERLLCKGKIIKKTTSERQLMKIFGIARKTIRKWKKKLQEQQRNKQMR
jgi:hypothetical protein